MLIAPYLRTGAPVFDMTINPFRKKFNLANPQRQISEYRAIASKNNSRLVRAASKINENLYASTFLEQGTRKITTLQLTWLPLKEPEERKARDTARAFMSALLRFFQPGIFRAEATIRTDNLQKKGKGSRYFASTEGVLRFVVADNSEKGLTFAIEPIILALLSSDSRDGSEGKRCGTLNAIWVIRRYCPGTVLN